MSWATPEDGDVAMYRHEETGEELHPKQLHSNFVHGNWKGEQIASENGTAWRITSPEDKRGVWRKADAESGSESESGSDS